MVNKTKKPNPLKSNRTGTIMRIGLRKLLDAKLLPGVLALFVAVYAVAVNRSNIEIKFDKEGATIITRGNETEKAILLLPATSMWMNTGLMVKPNQDITISATGKINLALHHLVDDDRSHKLPRLGWVGPDGHDQPYRSKKDRERAPNLIIKTAETGEPARYGTLIACIVYSKDDPLGSTKPWPMGRKLIGSKGTINGGDKGGMLWLVINDVALDANSKDIYVPSIEALTEEVSEETGKTGGEASDAAKAKMLVLEGEWKEISKGRFDIFFQDNIGEFLIQIQFNTK